MVSALFLTQSSISSSVSTFTPGAISSVAMPRIGGAVMMRRMMRIAASVTLAVELGGQEVEADRRRRVRRLRGHVDAAGALRAQDVHDRGDARMLRES